MSISRDSLQLMGTRIDLMIDSQDSQKLLAIVSKQLEDYEKRFSANSQISELAQLHAKAGLAPYQISPDLFSLIALGKEHSLVPKSQLNIALGPVIQSWRIGFADARLPTKQTIQKKLALCHPQDILLNTDQSSVFLRKQGMKLDLGGLAKGYISDQIVTFLKTQGVNSAMINLGGNVLVYGKNPQSPSGLWSVGIQNPQASKRGQYLLTLPVKNLSVVTSGSYERRLIHQGQSYHHILDPRTGYPVRSSLVSLTLISPSSLQADLWASRLFGLDKDLILTQINQQKQLEGILIDHNNQITFSKGLHSYVKNLSF
ncbi:FAD:protein FMN transferase [Streptococcus cuniculipharyngis]|uniref:FAD:protein FMN transferase n=1 Tax=Streptococcus cuniculipharyngis TaxID=1562651 RepID=A0A5C5SFB5_9STRE|nr:FAD:protein FMN transferase [Streptococcus cuniculipharyngis]TWS98808.1 FAD:protein FMN transferase [Streptococcus cuniculipharyngis]